MNEVSRHAMAAALEEAMVLRQVSRHTARLLEEAMAQENEGRRWILVRGVDVRQIDVVLGVIQSWPYDVQLMPIDGGFHILLKQDDQKAGR